MNSLRYCLIGCGRVSPSHIAAARDHRLSIVALCDVNPNAVTENLSGAGVDHISIYKNYQIMLKEVKPQLVAIATPSGLHAQMALDCLAAGAHVIIEKPMAMHMADAAKIAETAQKNDLIVGVSLQNRFNPAVLELRRAIENGRFGTIYGGSAQLLWHRGEDYYGSASWRGTKALDGGAMMNQGIHSIDLLNWMMGGKPAQVKTFRATLGRNIESEDLGMALLRYPSGALASITCTTLAHADDATIEVFGERGHVRLGGMGHTVNIWRFDDNIPGEEEAMRRRFCENPEHVYGDGHSLFYADVMRAIATGGQPLVNAQEGSHALEIILTAYEQNVSRETIGEK